MIPKTTGGAAMPRPWAAASGHIADFAWPLACGWRTGRRTAAHPIVETNPALGRKAGRDHHPQAFTTLMAGGGTKPGTYGETDDFGFHITKDKVHVHDLQATILHLLGFDRERLTYHHACRDFRFTDVHGHVVKDLIA